ncbi:hypothetical protein WA026_014914 [Henosepilachna vigintioctopunctata]|uniref:Uncharacterized protein n=1 Tax=Henosepilachna vigintioctopunctata TaxID=420089 RepID=A0AAW1V040_9CUCU
MKASCLSRKWQPYKLCKDDQYDFLMVLVERSFKSFDMINFSNIPTVFLDRQGPTGHETILSRSAQKGIKSLDSMEFSLHESAQRRPQIARNQ